MGKSYRKFMLLFCALLMLHVGCGDETSGPVKRSWGRMKGLKDVVGNMSDTSYSLTRSMKPRLNALGQPVPMASFEGKFLWVDYAAPWCNTCSKQTPQIQPLKAEFKKDIVFLTIMTSRSQTNEDHATIDTAKEWVNRYGLDPTLVLFAENIWGKTIPEHRLFSPKGHTLFAHVGFLSSDQIRQVIDYYKGGWDQWTETNNPPKWMKF